MGGFFLGLLVGGVFGVAITFIGILFDEE